jgi:hypothetical protein
MRSATAALAADRADGEFLYDLIARGNPVGLFGMVNVLEGTSIALATHAAGSIRERLALPDSAFSYLSSHGSLDIEHMQTYRRLMNSWTIPKIRPP